MKYCNGGGPCQDSIPQNVCCAYCQNIRNCELMYKCELTQRSDVTAASKCIYLVDTAEEVTELQ